VLISPTVSTTAKISAALLPLSQLPVTVRSGQRAGLPLAGCQALIVVAEANPRNGMVEQSNTVKEVARCSRDDSLVARLPETLLEKMGLKDGDEVNMTSADS
jgi:hypothetical protein